MRRREFITLLGGHSVMTFVYRYYDQAELERQLNARGTVADITPILARYASESARMRECLPCRLAISYGASEPERLDIFPATTKGSSPIFVFIHGGYWRLLDSGDSSFMAECLTQAGACVVAVNYALAPFVTLAEIVRQCRAAITWVHAHAHEFGGDPTRIHVGGSSAGGHLATMMLAPGWEADFSAPADLVAGATLLSGLFDLEPVRLGHPNEWLKLGATDAAVLSPLLHMPKRSVPLVVSYAPSETDEFKRQSEAYMAAAVARGCAVRFVPMPGTNHYDIVFGLADRENPLANAVIETMGLK
jgi:arylformamidase